MRRALGSLALTSAALLGTVVAIPEAAGDARAGARQSQAALVQLEAAYQATASAAPGAARTRQACEDAGKLKAAAAPIAADHAPATAAIDDDVWHLLTTRLRLKIANLVDVCQAPDHRLTLGTKVYTADGVAASLHDSLHAFLDAARPRDLPLAMKKFQTTMAAMRPRSKQLCTQHKQLAKLAPQLATPPDRAAADKWQEVHAALRAGLDELKQFGCGSPRGAYEEISGAMALVHEHYYKLVLLVPAQS